MLDLLRCMPNVVVFSALGYLLDRGLRLQLVQTGNACWPLRFSAGLLAPFLFVVHPFIGVVVIAAQLLRRRGLASPSSQAPVIRRQYWLLLFALVMIAFVATRPRVPVYWDEFSWMGKAQLEAAHHGELRSASLDPSVSRFGTGYPLLWPWASAWLAAPHTQVGTIVAGAQWLVVMAVVLFAGALETCLLSRCPRSVLAAAFIGPAICAITPFTLLHLRTVYADLPVGLIGATLACGFASSTAHKPTDASRWPTSATCLCGLLLGSIKDDGFGLAVAIAVGAFLASIAIRQRVLARMGAVLLGSAAVVYLPWQILLRTHHIMNPERVLQRPDLSRIPLILGDGFFRHLSDMTTWGGYWSLAVAALAATLIRHRRASSAARTLAIIWSLQIGMLVLGLTAAAPQVIRFITISGSVTNRLLLQMAPMAAVLMATSIRDALQTSVTAAAANPEPNEES